MDSLTSMNCVVPVLTSVDNEKYLGVTVSSDLSWSTHVNMICAKANQKLGLIKRNLKGTPEELKRLAYITIVRLGMETYACTIWDPSLSKVSESLERIQRQAVQ